MGLEILNDLCYSSQVLGTADVAYAHSGVDWEKRVEDTLWHTGHLSTHGQMTTYLSRGACIRQDHSRGVPRTTL